MKRLLSAKQIFAAAVVLGGFAAASAQAGTDVFLSIGVPLGGYVQPAPVYVQPQPVYVQPQPVYVQPQSYYVQPAPVYVQPQTVYYYRRHGHHGHRHGPWGDADRDGVPNRYDAAPNDPFRR